MPTYKQVLQAFEAAGMCTPVEAGATRHQWRKLAARGHINRMPIQSNRGMKALWELSESGAAKLRRLEARKRAKRDLSTPVDAPIVADGDYTITKSLGAKAKRKSKSRDAEPLVPVEVPALRVDADISDDKLSVTFVVRTLDGGHLLTLPTIGINGSMPFTTVAAQIETQRRFFANDLYHLIARQGGSIPNAVEEV